MAPEQCRGKAREASDQYALGVVVYEWLCGILPFQGASAIEIAMHHLMDLPPPLQDRASGISVEIEQVILKALAKDPQERFPSVQEFAQALEQASHPKKSVIAVLPLSVLLSQQLSSTTHQSTLPGRFVTPTQSTISTMPLVQVAEALPAAGTLLYTYHGHSDTISRVEQSSNSTHMVKETPRVRNVTTGKHIPTPRGHSKYVSTEHGHRIAHRLPQQGGVRWCRCGMPAQANRSEPVAVIPGLYLQSHGHRTAHRLPREVLIRQCKYGMPE